MNALRSTYTLNGELVKLAAAEDTGHCQGQKGILQVTIWMFQLVMHPYYTVASHRIETRILGGLQPLDWLRAVLLNNGCSRSQCIRPNTAKNWFPI